MSLQDLWPGLEKLSLSRWRSAGRWLVDGLVPVLVAANYQRFYVLVDEFEKIYMYQTFKRRDEFLDELRQAFYERDSTAVRRQYITTVLTLHPSIDRYLRDNWNRVGLEGLVPLDPEQVDQRAVLLGPSNLSKLKHLLVTYMNYYRITQEHADTLYPFTDDALDGAIEMARFYPRNTLRIAHEILRKAAASDRPPLIDAGFVQKCLTGSPVLEDEEDESNASPLKAETKLTEG